MEVQRRIFPKALKREAVARVSTSGLPPSKVASELGLHETVLRRWMRQSTASAPNPQQRMQPIAPSVADLAAENSRLRMERESLKNCDHLRSGGKMKFSFIQENSTT